MPSARIVGVGRAGGSLAIALGRVGWQVDTLGRGDDHSQAAQDVDVCIIATPDTAIAEVAESIAPGAAVIAHMAGSLGTDVLGAHEDRAALHPLMSLPDAQRGADQMVERGWWAVAGSSDRAASMVESMVGSLGGTPISVADEDRATYHAAAAIASNHTVALLGQVERVAAAANVPIEAFVPLILGSINNVVAMGASAALTGPVARGDEATLDRHRDALDPSELELYEALVIAARRLSTSKGSNE